mmetsp:Transcript_35255/g.71410  ORF Transcript_35255/g.71410 Transcript_35255/m.71410 type:complete len:1096 (+) Transcript_35255:1-3288(+)
MQHRRRGGDGTNESSYYVGSSMGKNNTTCDDTDPNSTSFTSASSIADQSMAMMGKLMSGGAAMCGSLVQVAEDDNANGDDSRQDSGGILAKAERIVNCNKFAQSTPMNYDFASRRSSGGNFLGPDEDSDDEVDVSSAFRRSGITKNLVLHDENPNDTTNTSSMSSLFARAMVSEVHDNPNTMKQVELAEREKRLLKAQEKARQAQPDGPRVIGAPGGVAAPKGVLGTMKNLRLTEETIDAEPRDPSYVDEPTQRVIPPDDLGGKMAQLKDDSNFPVAQSGKHTITIGLCLSRKHSAVGHPDTITRQTAFDFNELQDRNYKYVSSTDNSGWLAGGGESANGPMPDVSTSLSGDGVREKGAFGEAVPLDGAEKEALPTKIAAPDTVHIPILHIDCSSEKEIDQVISSLASGELFIPQMSILPESLSASGESPPDLVVRFGCERNDDLSPDLWPNWCIEFMHNQLYEYFEPLGARWMPRPFEITLARRVRWRTVKHMNKYFAHCERVIDIWREQGPQYLKPQSSYLKDGATPEEVSQPHGIYLIRNGVPTNYFAPNFEPPYTTKMTRSLLSNVVNKSWDKKKRDWTSEPTPKIVTPAMLIGKMCGCTDGGRGGFIATEATRALSPVAHRYVPPHDVMPNDHSSEYNNNFADFSNFDHSGEYSEFERIRRSQISKPQNDSSGAVLGANDSFNNVSDLPTDDKNAVIENSADFPAEASVISKDSSGAMDSRTPEVAVVQSTIPSNNIIPGSADVVEKLGAQAQAKPSKKKKKRNKEQQKRKERIRAITETIERQDSLQKKAPDRNGSASKSYRRPGEADLRVVASRSVGESQTTVPINNKSAPRIIEDERERCRRSQAERKQERKKMDALEQKLEEKKMQAIRDERLRLQSSNADDDEENLLLTQQASTETSKKRADGNKKSLRGENMSQIRLIAEAQEETRKARALITRTPARLEDQTIKTSPSGETLEYSVDSSSILREKVNSKSSANKATTGTSTMKNANHFACRDDFSSSTVGSSTILPLPDAVPSDEELFAFGWAKALDSNSGAYYYFTLDRTQTVWENPIADRDLVTKSLVQFDSPAKDFLSSTYTSTGTKNMY